MATPEASSSFAYVTAPSTPIRCHSLEHMYFYSVPTSPTKFSPRVATEPTTPNPYVDASSEFQFESSYRFDMNDSDFEVSRNFEYDLEKEETRQRGGSLPAMAFADELFCDGKVMPLRPPPLKLPPRLQHSEFRNRDVPRGTKLRFSNWSSWKEQDFDPFTVAMKKVSEDKTRKCPEEKSPETRRARSVSLSRVNSPKRPNGSLVYPSNSRSGPIILVQQPGPSEDTDMEQEGKKSFVLAEPKGLSFARSLRMVKMGHEGPMKVCSSKRHKIKEFLFRTPTMKVDKSEDKMVDPNSPQWYPKMARRFSFKSGRSVQVYGEKEKVCQVANGALVQYRPRLFLCLGYGMKKSTF